jgi:hypothetical protein
MEWTCSEWRATKIQSCPRTLIQQKGKTHMFAIRKTLRLF